MTEMTHELDSTSRIAKALAMIPIWFRKSASGQDEAYDGRTATVSELLERDRTSGFVPAPLRNPVKLRVGSNEISMDLLIRDGLLGTLGLVHVVSEPFTDSEGKGISACAWFQERVNEAVYLRHELLASTSRSSTERRPLPYTVEIVFAFDEKTEDRRMDAAQVMHTLMRGGSILHSIGA